MCGKGRQPDPRYVPTLPCVSREQVCERYPDDPTYPYNVVCDAFQAFQAQERLVDIEDVLRTLEDPLPHIRLILEKPYDTPPRE